MVLTTYRKRKWLAFDPHRTYSRRYVDHFYETLGGQISGEVLDVGAGSNNRAELKAITDGISSYIALDIEFEESLDVVGDGANLPFENGSFDTVVLSEVIEHVPVPDLPRIANEVYRVLKPGGVLLASTPFVYPQHGPPDYARHTPQSVEELFHAAGFDDVVVYTGGGYTETLLHVAYRPIVDLLEKVNARTLGWAFAVPHYMGMLSSVLTHHLALGIAGRNPRADIWYLMTFTVARKTNQ